MTALDVSEYVAAFDSPEVAALKEKVKEVAERYAKRHNWCDVVKQALIEAGCMNDDKTTLLVKVTLTLGFVFDVKIPPGELHEKTEAEQKAILAEKIGTVSLVGANKVTGGFKVAPSSITTMEAVPPPPTPEHARHAAWRYLGNDGRVRHLFVASNAPNTNSSYTACGETNYNTGQERSTRGEDRGCARCSQSALGREYPHG